MVGTIVIMNLLQSVILGIVEGLSEFLPISSTGHLILASHLMQIPSTEFVKTFEIVIQFGAILSVVFLYTKRFATNWRALLKLSVSFVVTSIIGLALYKFVKDVLLGNDLVVVASLFLGGLAMLYAERVYKPEQAAISKIEDTSWGKAVVIGIFQALAVIPGVSRSAATIIGSLFLGLTRETAVEYSFLLAVPTMAAASGLDLVKTHMAFTGTEIMVLLVGCVVSFVVAVVAIKSFLAYVQRHNFNAFAIYRIAAAIAYFLLVIR